MSLCLWIKENEPCIKKSSIDEYFLGQILYFVL